MSNNAFGKATNVDPDLPLSPDGTTYHLTCKSNQLADRIILVGDPGRVKTVAEYLDAGSITYEASHREINIATGTYGGKPVSVVSTGMGTDNLEIIINEIHVLKEYDVSKHQWRARAGDEGVAAADVYDPSKVRIIRVGTCGSPNPEVEVGCLAVTRYGVGMDNTCQYYKPSEVMDKDPNLKLVADAIKATSLNKVQIYTTKASPKITEAIVKSCDTFNTKKAAGEQQKYYVGATCSCSGFYGCQGRTVGRFRGHLTVPNLMDELSKVSVKVAEGTERIANLEMENSSLCYLSGMLGYQAGTVCVVIARRFGDNRAFATPDQAAKGLSNAITIALNAITLE